jgi:hypothetical protein
MDSNGYTSARDFRTEEQHPNIFFRPISQLDTASSPDEEIPVTYEEPWNDVIEDLLRVWKDEAKRESEHHRSAGYRLRFKYGLLNFIIILWASINLVSSNFFECDNETISKLISLVINSLQVFLSGLNSSMNLGYQYRVHFDFEAKFMELFIDIDAQLVRGRDFRLPADAFMTEVRERKKRLTEAPEIPKGRFFFC